MGQIYQQQNILEKALQLYTDALKINQTLYDNATNGSSGTSSSKLRVKNS